MIIITGFILHVMVVVDIVAGGSALELLLGPDGEYIREIIIDELAKGIDAGWRSSFDSFVGSTRQRLLSAFRVGAKSLPFSLSLLSQP